MDERQGEKRETTTKKQRRTAAAWVSRAAIDALERRVLFDAAAAGDAEEYPEWVNGPSDPPSAEADPASAEGDPAPAEAVADTMTTTTDSSLTVSVGVSMIEGASEETPETPGRFRFSGCVGGVGPPPSSITVKYELSGSANKEATTYQGPDYEGPLLTGSVDIPTPNGAGAVEVTFNAIDDRIADAPPGEPAATETVIVTITDVVGNWSQITKSGPATATIMDDSSWFYTPWEVKRVPNIGMRGPLRFIGERELRPEGQFYFVERYYYYDEFLRVHDGEYGNDYGASVDLNLSMQYTTQTTWGAQLGLTVGGEPFQVNWTVYAEYQEGTGTEVGASIPAVTAAANEKLLVVPLVRRRVIIKENHSYNLDDQLVSSSETREYYYTGDVDYAVLSHRRQWIDEEHSIARLRLPSPPGEPLNLDELLNGPQ